MSNEQKNAKTFQEKILEANIELIDFMNPDPVEGDEIGIVRIFKRHGMQEQITVKYKFNGRKWKYVEIQPIYMPL